MNDIPTPENFTRSEDKNRIFLVGHIDGDRYMFDHHLKASDGWMQYDTAQDASYFGVWVNPKRMATITFAEGDVSIVICKTPKAYNAEIEKMNEFYEASPFMAVIESDGKVVEFVQDRSQFLITA